MAEQNYKDQVRALITGAGLQLITVADIPSEDLAKVSSDSSEPVDSDYTERTVAQARGVVAAVSASALSPEFTTQFKKHVRILFANAAKDGDMATIAYPPRNLVIEVNMSAGSLLTPARLEQNGVNNVSAAQYKRVLDAGATELEALETYYKFATWHEIGHVLNAITNGALVKGIAVATLKMFVGNYGKNPAAFVNMLKSGGGGDRVLGSIRSGISNYAATTPDETLGELASMTLGGLPVPKQFQEVSEALRNMTSSASAADDAGADALEQAA
jgi:hypothetical protein